MSRPAVVRVALAGPCAALSLSGCDSRSAIHQLAAVADGWSDSPKVIWPPPRTPVESEGASCAGAAAGRS